MYVAIPLKKCPGRDFSSTSNGKPPPDFEDIATSLDPTSFVPSKMGHDPELKTGTQEDLSTHVPRFLTGSTSGSTSTPCLPNGILWAQQGIHFVTKVPQAKDPSE